MTKDGIREQALCDLVRKFREFKQAATKCRKLGISARIPTGAMMPDKDVKDLRLITGFDTWGK